MKYLLKKISIAIVILSVLTFVLPNIVPTFYSAKIANAAIVKFNKKHVKIKVGETYQLNLYGTKSKVKWSSGKKSIASVSSDGLVTGIKSGSTIISATVGDKTYKCAVTVLRPKLNNFLVKLGIGDTFKLKINDFPLNYTKRDVKYKSRNENVASVDENGLITALSEGTTNIIVSFGDNELICAVCVNFTDENKADVIKSLKIEYVDLNNQIVCLVENVSNINLTFGYDMAFYDDSDNLVSISGITGNRDGFFKGDSKVLYFDKPQKEYSYYKIRFNDIWGQYYYLNVKDKVDITASEAYDYKCTEFISGDPISKTETLKVIDLNVNNHSENRVMLEAYVVYYKDNSIVNIENFTKRNGNIDVGSTVIKNPLTTGFIGGKIAVAEYDNYKIIYTARTLKY